MRFEGVIEGEMGMWKCGKGVWRAFDLVGKKQEEVEGGGWVLGVGGWYTDQPIPSQYPIPNTPYVGRRRGQSISIPWDPRLD